MGGRRCRSCRGGFDGHHNGAMMMCPRTVPTPTAVKAEARQIEAATVEGAHPTSCDKSSAASALFSSLVLLSCNLHVRFIHLAS